MNDEASADLRRGTRSAMRRRIGALLTILAAAATTVVLLQSSGSAQSTTTAIESDDCNTAAEVAAMTTPGAPVAFQLRAAASAPNAAGRGIGWRFDPQSTPNSAQYSTDYDNPSDADVCNNVASYEIWYSTNRSDLTGLSTHHLTLDDPPSSRPNVRQIERNMPILLGRWGSWGDMEGGIPVDDTYYAMMRVNFLRICNNAQNDFPVIPDDTDTTYIYEATDAVPTISEIGSTGTGACNGLHGAWSSIRSVTLPPVSATVNSAIPDKVVGPNQTFDFTVPHDTFHHGGKGGNALKRGYRTTAVASDSLTAAEVDLPDWLDDYPGNRGVVTARRFRGKAPATAGTTYIKVTSYTAYHGEISDVFALTVRNRAPTVHTIPEQSVVAGNQFDYTIPRSLVYDPDFHTLVWSVTNKPYWMSGRGFVTVGAGTNRTIRLLGTPNRVGSYDIDFTVADFYGGSTQGTVTVNVTNSAPTVANAISNQTASVGSTFCLKLRANVFDDADGHSLMWDLTTSPSWLTGTTYFDGDSIAMTLRGTPTTAASAADVTITASEVNGGGASVTETFTITVADDGATSPNNCSTSTTSTPPTPSNADLTSLRLLCCRLNPVFSYGTTSYTSSVTGGNLVADAVFTKRSSSATVTYNPATDDNPRLPGHQWNLTQGTNVVSVTVTSGVTSKTYTVTITVGGV